MKRGLSGARFPANLIFRGTHSLPTGVAWNNSIWAAQSTHTERRRRWWRRAPRWEIQFNAIRKSVRLFIITVRGRMSGGRRSGAAAARAPVFSFIVRMQIRSFRKYCVTQPKYKAGGRTPKIAPAASRARIFAHWERIIGRGGQNFASTPASAREGSGWMAVRRSSGE